MEKIFKKKICLTALILGLSTLFFMACKTEVTPEYTVTFVTSIGEAPSPIVVLKGTVLQDSHLPRLSASGNSFDGWYYNNTLVVAGKFTVESDITLEAHWTEIKTVYRKVTYESDIGTVPENLENVKNGYKLKDTDLPTMDDGIHTFEGWVIKNPESGEETPVEVGFKVTKDIILVAKWKSYTITIYRDHSETPETFTVYDGDCIPESELYTNNDEGYDFVMWKLEDDRLPENYYPSEDITIKSEWKMKSFTFKFYKNIPDDTSTPIEQIINYEPAGKLRRNTYTRTNYVFIGWNTKADGSGDSYTNEQEIVKPVKDLDLYAQWDPKELTVTFRPNGATGSSYTQTFKYNVSQNIEPNKFTYSGYRFVKWTTSSNGSGSSYEDGEEFTATTNVTLYAQWIPADAYSISYMNTFNVTNENPASYRTSVGVESFINISRTGYDFDGWYESADENGNGTGIKVTSIPAGSRNEDITLYAKWTPKKYTVTFMPNGAAEEAYTQEFYYGIPAKLMPNAFTYRYYEFTGWNTTSSSSYGTSYSDEAEYTIRSSNVTLYARWKLKDTYSITYENTRDAYNRNDSTYQGTKGLSLDSLSLSGYDFDGWYEEADENGNGCGEKITKIIAGEKEGDLVLYAKWTPRTDTKYTVNIFKMATDGTYSNYRSDYENYTGTTDEMTLFEPPVYEHFTLQPYENQKIKGDGSTIIKVYYEREAVTISFDLDGGTGTEKLEGYYDGKIEKPADPTRSGFKFMGWEPSFPNYSYRTFETDEAYKAKWEILPVIEINIENDDSEMTVLKEVDGSLVTVTVPEEFKVIRWMLDNKLLAEKSNTYSLDTENMKPGTYGVFVETEKDGKSYSAQIYVDIK